MNEPKLLLETDENLSKFVEVESIYEFYNDNTIKGYRLLHPGAVEHA